MSEGVIERLRSNTKKSAFNRQGYRVSCELGFIHRSLRFYSEVDNKSVCDKEIIQSMIPAFQRDNNKWDRKRKIKFIENIIAGYPTDITLFTVNNDILDDCKIIDGQQRLTAIDDWFNGEFPIYGDIFYSQLSHLRRAPFADSRVSLVIHNFKSETEAVKYYIDINEGISHSNLDILRAYRYLESM